MNYYIIIHDDAGKVIESYELKSSGYFEDAVESFKTAFSLYGSKARLVVDIPMTVELKATIHSMYTEKFKEMIQ